MGIPKKKIIKKNAVNAQKCAHSPNSPPFAPPVRDMSEVQNKDLSAKKFCDDYLDGLLCEIQIGCLDVEKIDENLLEENISSASPLALTEGFDNYDINTCMPGIFDDGSCAESPVPSIAEFFNCCRGNLHVPIRSDNGSRNNISEAALEGNNAHAPIRSDEGNAIPPPMISIL